MAQSERERGGEQDRGEAMRARYAAAVAEIEEMVKAGKMTREEGAKAIEETRKSAGDQRERIDPIALRIREIEEMVRAGKMTREEGARAIEEVRKSGSDERTRAEAARIRAAVEAGTMTREEAAAALKRLGIIR